MHMDISQDLTGTRNHLETFVFATSGSANFEAFFATHEFVGRGDFPNCLVFDDPLVGVTTPLSSFPAQPQNDMMFQLEVLRQ